MFELFIAKRYLKSKNKLSFITIISLLSTLGITIGVAALIVVLSVFNGFGSLVKSILINIDPHIKINIISNNANKFKSELNSILKSEPNIKNFYPFVEGKVIITNRSSYQIVNLKGLDSNYAFGNHGINKMVTYGELNFSDNTTYPHIAIGLSRALKFGGRIGDTITITAINNLEKSFINFTIPVSKKFIIGAVFESNNLDVDNSVIFCELNKAVKVFNYKHKISGYELLLSDINKAEHVKNNLLKTVSKEDYSINTWYELHKDLYNVMLIERWAAYLLLSLIIAIASFNILASLTMSVIEKRKDIAVLRSLGSSEKSIMRIFMFEGILVGIIGTLSGIVLG
ncbi:MAG TPA: ABC transporter permease, partial [Melioribacteraceae bacterium]|nr:ABC transporter permease [Melioribacteraceae bacterium]